MRRIFCGVSDLGSLALVLLLAAGFLRQFNVRPSWGDNQSGCVRGDPSRAGELLQENSDLRYFYSEAIRKTRSLLKEQKDEIHKNHSFHLPYPPSTTDFAEKKSAAYLLSVSARKRLNATFVG